MTAQDTSDLRRLAEQAIAAGWSPNACYTTLGPLRDYNFAANPQAILRVLDERDGYKRMLDDSVHQQLAREGRVAALEEGLEPAIIAAYCKVKHGYIHGQTCDSYNAKGIAAEARALLAAAPDHQHTWQWVQTGPESGGRVCSECGHPETLSEAAAPSEPWDAVDVHTGGAFRDDPVALPAAEVEE